MTKPSLLAFHGSIAPCPGIHAVAFLCYEHNPTVSKPLRYSHRCEQCSSPAGTCRKPLLFSSFNKLVCYVLNFMLSSCNYHLIHIYYGFFEDFQL